MHIYVGNLNYDIEEEELKNLFGEHGEVTSVKIIRDKYTGRAKGFGFVEMAEDDAANNAINALNGTEVMGRQMRVNQARPPRERDEY